MADGRRLRLLKAITTTLEGISVADGFNTDLGAGKVFRGRSYFGESDPVPMISILEAPLPPDQQQSPDSSDVNDSLLELVVQGFTLDDADNPTDPAHVLLADAKRALAQEKAKENEGSAFGFKWVRRIIIGPGVVRPPDEISAHAYFWMTLSIDFVDDLLNPSS